MRRIITLIVAALSMISAIPACVSAENSQGDRGMEGFVAVAELHVVDCLLPGQVRTVGRRTYLTPRRPIRTTAADCQIRGGEYTSYDRADYKSALKVWLPSAEAGAAEAQVNVGEIFERGLGGEPNYPAALIWYRKAAEQGNTRAQFNLGTLYEQGLGVEKQTLTALNWYRLAWGITEDNVIFSKAAAREREALREQLQSTVREKQTQIDVLQKQLTAFEEKLNISNRQNTDAQTTAETLKSLIAQLEEQRKTGQAELEAIPVTREPAPAAPREQPISPAVAQTYRDMNLGRYYALLIGNQHYSELEDLNTPITDIGRAKRVLEEKYGFVVFTITDGDNIEVMRAINDLYDIVGEDDNLLIFYAGHGNRLTTGDVEVGYWLPSNAERPPRNTFWVANEFVTGHLSRIKAKRVLIVADSCYAGLLSTEPSFLLLGDDGPQYSNKEFLRFKLGKRSRLLLSSGGDRPVLDGSGGGHSVFANAFLDELETNSTLLPGPELFLRIQDRVRIAAAGVDFDQRPEFKTIKAAGHEVGDFFFVPAELR
ncbi:MAG: caspase family protein [Gammaproteobacteria bacterium]|nr:caspase family protein [Gammaproteobacteria bacterium]